MAMLKAHGETNQLNMGANIAEIDIENADKAKKLQNIAWSTSKNSSFGPSNTATKNTAKSSVTPHLPQPQVEPKTSHLKVLLNIMAGKQFLY